MGWGNRSTTALDGVLAAALATFAVAESAAQSMGRHPQSEVLALVAAGAVTLRRRAPLVMCLLAAAAVTAFAFLPGAATPLWTFVVALVVAFSAGAHLEGRLLGLALAALLVSGYVLQLAGDSTPAETALSPLVVMGAPALAGVLLRRARAQAARLRSLAAQLELEREHHAAAVALAERHRIARELHDVIAHTVSTMVVQAGAAEQLLAPGSPAREPVAAVRLTGRDALAELRRLLGVLRSTDGHPVVGPQPGLDQLPTLVTDAGASWRTDGEPYAVGPGIGLAAYRIVQEALTNARRHGGPSPAAVLLTYGDQALGVTITSSLTTREAREEGPLGHGLTGMRERVELYGGALRTGPVGDTWVVDAWLPRTGSADRGNVVTAAEPGSRAAGALP